jgi:hypothetical protein
MIFFFKKKKQIQINLNKIRGGGCRQCGGWLEGWLELKGHPQGHLGCGPRATPLGVAVGQLFIYYYYL